MSRPKLDAPNYRLIRRNGWFYVRWTEDRVTKQSACRTQDEDEAKRILAEWQAPSKPEQSTISTLVEFYLRERLPRVAAPSRLKELAKPLNTYFGHMWPNEVTRDLTRSYARWRQCSPGTIRRELSGLRSALRLAEREGWIDRAPYIELPPNPEPRQRWLTRDEAAKLVEGAKANHIRLWMLLALNTGARKSAILSLMWEAVDLERRRISFRHSGTSKRNAIVPINDSLYGELCAAQNVARTEYVIEYAGRSVASIKRGFRAACERAGLEDVTPHDLRRTAGAWMAMAGVEMRKISLMLGHTSIAVTERVYAPFHPDYLADAAKALEG